VRFIVEKAGSFERSILQQRAYTTKRAIPFPKEFWWEFNQDAFVHAVEEFQLMARITLQSLVFFQNQ